MIIEKHLNVTHRQKHTNWVAVEIALYGVIERFQMFDKWWKNKRPISCDRLNHYNSYKRLYYAALYGFDEGLKTRITSQIKEKEESK